MPAPTFDNASIAESFTAASSLTFSHVVSGTERFLVVFVGIRELGTPAVTVSSITYNGTNLTQACTVEDATASQSIRGDAWYLQSPDTGTHDVVITLSGTSELDLHGIAVSLNAVGSSGFKTSTTKQGLSATNIFDSSIDASMNDMVLDFALPQGGAASWTYGSGQTENESNAVCASSRKIGTGNPTTSSITGTGVGDFWLSLAVAVKGKPESGAFLLNFLT